ncbi:MAG TPA: sarcosine oxidase subunit gamma family protein [Acetobacteraceae bacterium]|jgi:sarcosine oxidase, subunit gamma|nr:sarcosine oxidase subunit gamma family protein [Acetobacteraceae bacterium]
MADFALARHGPLGATLAVLPSVARFSFRGDPSAARVAGDAFGVLLSETPCRAAKHGARAALWLGPDEWTLLAPPNEGPEIAAAIARSLGDRPHALVDIAHRDIGIAVAGTDSAVIVNAGCPLDLDLSSFPIDHCTRTVFAKAGIVLWREDTTRFRIEVARSFATYLWQMLARGSAPGPWSRALPPTPPLGP